MFEQSVVESTIARPSSRKAMTLPLSVALHVIAVAGAVFGAVWDVEFPLTPPPQIEELTNVFTPRLEQGRPPGEQQRKQEVKPKIAPPDAPPTIVPNNEPKVSEAPALSEDAGETVASNGHGGGGLDPNGRPDGDPDSISLGPPAEVEPRQLLRPGGDVKAPVVLRRVDPVYPPLLVRMRLEGIAIVECIIDRDGNVQSVKSIHATHELFRGAAEDAVARWKFRPGTLNGAPVDVIFNLTVSFKLNS